MIFQQIVLDLYAYNLHKNAEKPGVISFLSQIFSQKAVHVSVRKRTQVRLCITTIKFIPHLYTQIFWCVSTLLSFGG